MATTTTTTTTTATTKQKRLLFKIPLDKNCTIHPDPGTPVTSLLIRTDQGDLYYSILTGRQLRFVRNNVQALLWIGRKKFLILDSATHDLIFYKIETASPLAHSATADSPVQFVSVLQFAFQFVSSILLEFGLALNHADEVELINYLPLTGYLDFLVKREYFLRILVDSQKRIFRVVSCLKLGRNLIRTASPLLTLMFVPGVLKTFLISSQENEFLVSFPLRELLRIRPFADPSLIAFSPDFRWLIIATKALDIFQIFLPTFQSTSWSHLHKASLHAAMSSLRFQEDDAAAVADNRKALRRVNAVWDREVGDMVAKNSAKQNFTPDGWIFAEGSAAGTPGESVESVFLFRPPVDFAGAWCPLALHCTESEIYVTAKNADGHVLLGVKQVTISDPVWMVFTQECIITFPTSTSYPVTLFYPMSMAIIASDGGTGFQREIAEAAAPDPWEDLTELQVMEVALNQDIVDKAVDYLQRRFPDRLDMFASSYPREAAQAIAREYLEDRNIEAAKGILSLVELEVTDEMKAIFMMTDVPEYRQWLKDTLLNWSLLTDDIIALFDYLTVLEAHLTAPLSMESVEVLSLDQRQTKLLEAAIDTKDKQLVATFPLEYVWSYLLASRDEARIVQWIRGGADFIDIPMDTSFCERLNDVDDELKETIRSEFALQNVFSAVESSDWRLYIQRLRKAFGEGHVFFQQGNTSRLDCLPAALKKQFLDFCLEKQMISVILEVADQSSFAEYLTERGEEDVPEWLTLLLLFRRNQLELSEDLRDLALKSAQFCWGGEVTVERLLELGETEVALGLICLCQNEWPPVNHMFDDSDSVHCLDLLQKQIAKFPKLREALYPIHLTEADHSARSVTAYRLLQANALYDPRKLFGWQSTNTVNTLYRAVEMPSFSNSDLQDKYGYKKELDFVYYLKNSRPAFAYWSFVCQLTVDNFKDELMAGRDMAFFLALFFYLDNAVVGACVAFLEMLGIESLSTRVNVQAARRIHAHQEKVFASHDSADLIRDIFIELFKYGSEVAGSVLEDLVAATNAAILTSATYSAGWEASNQWILVNQFAELFDLPLPLEYLITCAAANEWLNFLAYCELFQYPVALVLPLLDTFPQPHLAANLRLIMQNVKSVKHDAHTRHDGTADGGPANRNIRSTLYNRIGVIASDRTTSSTSDDDVRSARDTVSGKKQTEVRPVDMVETLRLAQKSLHPWRELLNFALEFHSPIYAMIASGEPGVDRLSCLAVNLFTGLIETDMINYRSTEDLPSSLFDFHWTRLHVESLIKLHAARGDIRLVHVALSLVAQDSVIEQLIALTADLAEREDRTVVGQRLKKLVESVQRAATVAKPDKTKGEVEDFKWALESGLTVLAELLGILKTENELEWRAVLQILRDSGLHLAVAKVRKQGESVSEVVEKLLQDIGMLSQSAQVDASRLMELKSLLRDFQKSSLWKNESFRIEVWQSIFGRVHVELTEKQSTDELIEMLTVAKQASDSPLEKNILATIKWKLDDTDERMRAAWDAKVSFGLVTATPLDEWMTDELIGAGSRRSDLQQEILAVGAMSLATFKPYAGMMNGVNGRSARDMMLEEIIAFLLKQGNLSLAARIGLIFGYLHADLDAVCTALALARWDITVDAIPGWIVAEVQNPKRKLSVSSVYTTQISSSGGEFEDDVVIWLRKIADICSLGRDVVLAILDNYCFAKFLQVGFEDMLVYSTSQVLGRLFALPALDQLALAKRCLVSFKANTIEITAFISGFVIDMLQRGLAAPQADPKVVGDSIRPFLAVAIDLVSLGNHLIDAVTNTTPPDSNLTLRVEILIAAHEVLSRAGTLDGLSRLLAACKAVSRALADAGDYHSLLRLLNGVGRYSDLTFIFHFIKEADKMEMLFSRGVEKDPKLKNAILNYLRKFHADDGDTFEMLAAAYSMHREIGETFLGIAQDKMALFKHRPIVDTGETQLELKRIAQFLMDAANSFSRAECYSRTEKCIEQARLVALQIVFLPTGLRLLSLNNPSGFVSMHPRFAEAYIYGQAYGITEEWADAVYSNYVLNGDISYLEDFLIKFEVTVPLVSEVAKKFRADTAKPPTAVIYMKKLLRQINDVETTFRLANELAINDLSMEILQIDGGAFLRDVMKF